MERRAWPNLEIGFEKHGVAVNTDCALAVMHGIRRIGMNEGAGSNEGGTLGRGELLGCRRRWEDVGEEEKTQRNTEAGTDHSAERRPAIRSGRTFDRGSRCQPDRRWKGKRRLLPHHAGGNHRSRAQFRLLLPLSLPRAPKPSPLVD